ncbi:MAG: glycosyltransferase [Deltaproteobacteria bacterium]|nr:glycosyltransferase [Deltaproteobacteria bacterium]
MALKIGLALPMFTAGGAEQVVLGLAREYLGLGHEAVIMSMSAGGNMRERFLKSGARLKEFGIKREFRLSPGWIADIIRARTMISRCLLEEGFDVVHTHLMGTDMDFLYAAKRAGVKAVVHTIHNVYRQYAGGKPVDRLRNWRRRAAYRRYDRVFAVDDEVRDWAVERGMVEIGGITTVRNGISFSSLNVKTSRQELRKKYGLGPNDRMVLNTGSLTAQKNQLSLIRAVHLLAQKGMEIRLFIAGEGVLRGELEREVKALGIESSVRLLGYREDIPSLLKAADVFAFPSLWEGLPIALLEALACGTTALASDIPVHRKILGAGRFGWLTPAASPEEIAGVLEKTLKSVERSKGNIIAAREMVIENYSAGRMAKEYISSYLEILNGGKA